MLRLRQVSSGSQIVRHCSQSRRTGGRSAPRVAAPARKCPAYGAPDVPIEAQRYFAPAATLSVIATGSGHDAVPALCDSLGPPQERWSEVFSDRQWASATAGFGT